MRKLTLESFLASPTTRLGRYLLHLKPALKNLPQQNESDDAKLIPLAVEGLRELLSKVNVEVGKADNRLKLATLNTKLFCDFPDYNQELDLLNDQRQIIREGKLTVRRVVPSSEQEVTVFLFDHMLLLTREKDNGYKIWRKVDDCLTEAYTFTALTDPNRYAYSACG